MRSEVLALLLFVFACTSPPKAQNPVNEPPSTLPTVTFADGYVVHTEVAATDEVRAQGLMYRDRLREGYGMIFLFQRSDVYPFWMKNTLIPLDMIWIDENQRVVHVKNDVPPCQADPCPSYDPGVAARYVLEVAAGVARKHGVKTGDQLGFSGLNGVVIR